MDYPEEREYSYLTALEYLCVCVVREREKEREREGELGEIVRL